MAKVVNRASDIIQLKDLKDGDHEFDAILEVHHLKGILEFDEDTLIKEINNENNLVWLCPNHHIMLEKGLISLE